MGKKAGRVCAHCGGENARTDDHLPPQSLYPKAARKANERLNSVPACPECNNGACSDDEVFKVMILAEAGKLHHSASDALDSLAATLSQNRRIYGHFEKSFEVYLPSRTGLQAKQKVTFPTEPYERVIERIVRGLYWQEYGNQCLGLAAKVDVLPKYPSEQHWALLRKVWFSMTWSSINNRTFNYGHIRAADGSSVWAMQFFGSTLAYAIAHPAQ